MASDNVEVLARRAQGREDAKRSLAVRRERSLTVPLVPVEAQQLREHESSHPRLTASGRRRRLSAVPGTSTRRTMPTPRAHRSGQALRGWRARRRLIVPGIRASDAQLRWAIAAKRSRRSV